METKSTAMLGGLVGGCGVLLGDWLLDMMGGTCSSASLSLLDVGFSWEL